MNKLVLTFDLDWCSDEVLQYVLDKLIKDKVPATFFVTHPTSLLSEIRKYYLLNEPWKFNYEEMLILRSIEEIEISG